MFYKGGKKRKGYEEPVVMLENFNLFCHKQCQLPVLLRACPREDQAVVIHAISPISMKLGQNEGPT